MKPPPPRRALISAGSGVHARVGPQKSRSMVGATNSRVFGVPLRGGRPALKLVARRGFQSLGGWHLISGGRAGEGGLEITKLAFLSGSKPTSRTSRLPPD
jgi:hypothetical protein